MGMFADGLLPIVICTVVLRAGQPILPKYMSVAYDQWLLDIALNSIDVVLARKMNKCTLVDSNSFYKIDKLAINIAIDFCFFR